MILRPGTFLQDRYEILEQIGSGGMSVVYKAKCHVLNRLVAIKVLKDEFCNDENFVKKFKMEAQAAAGLSHPNIVNIYDVIDERNMHYIVMELIEGITLKSYIRKKGKLDPKESIGIAIQVAQGVEAAHERHIIHRDIKPQNMMISRDGKVKVADFGIARAVSAQTLNSVAMGSVHYISPEQARGCLSDERSDIYSLGITMYEMVTGRLPFEGENTVSIALAHLQNAMVPPSVYNPEVPKSVEQIILKCCQKKPERRYSSANEVIADLRKALMDRGEETQRSVTEDAASQGRVKANVFEDATMKISDRDMAKIKERSRQETAATRKTEHDEIQLVEGKTSGTLAGRPNGKSNGNPNGKKVAQESVNHSFERIFAAAGVVTAVIVVAILIVVVIQLGDVFKGSSHQRESDAYTQDSKDNGLSDTEAYMPDILGMTEEMAESRLKEDYLTMKRTYGFFDDVEKGRIAQQNPEAGEVVLKGSSVNVVISNGSDKVDLTALGIDHLDGTTAQKFLENKNFVVRTEEEESETVEKGKVLRYEPTLVADGGIVTLYISSGPHIDTVPMPYLVGKQEEEAIALLAESGLVPENSGVETSDTIPIGCVVNQSQETGAQVPVGTTIAYTVSGGAEIKTQRYVASINEVYDLSNLIGPGAGSASVTVMIRLHQGTEDEPVYKVLTTATNIKGDVLLPVNYTAIESVDGTDQGEVEIVDVNSGAVLKSYPLTFFPMD